MPGRSSSKSPTTSETIKPIIILFGPTAVGKTAILSRFDSARYSVINADSIQVYKGLDIGSAKATGAEREAIEHHLIDIREMDQSFSVGDFIEAADEAVALIHSQNKIPIISGGTAFYVKHFLYGLSEAPSSNEDVRARVGALIEEKGLSWGYKRLAEVDPVSADRIHPNDTYRISRALEVYEQSGKPLSSFDLPSEPRIVNPVLIIGLNAREDLLIASNVESRRWNPMGSSKRFARSSDREPEAHGLRWRESGIGNFSNLLKAANIPFNPFFDASNEIPSCTRNGR